MAAPKNTWQVFDTSEPLLAWRCRVPAPDDDTASDITSELIVALTPLVVVDGPLPGEAEALSGEAKPVWRSRLTGRDAKGDLVEADSRDAGALLRSWEPLEEAYARRFAATGHPAVAVWVEREPRVLTLSVGFFATAYFDDRDSAVYQKNHARLIAARDEVTAIARRRGAQVQLPTSLHAK